MQFNPVHTQGIKRGVCMRTNLNTSAGPGRTPSPKTIRALAARKSKASIEVLDAVANDPAAPPAARVSAAATLLEFSRIPVAGGVR